MPCLWLSRIFRSPADFRLALLLDAMRWPETAPRTTHKARLSASTAAITGKIATAPSTISEPPPPSAPPSLNWPRPMTNPTSKLSPPTLHWGTVGPDGDRCDVCRAIIKPSGDCFVSIRRAFEFQNDRHTHRMVEVEPITVVMCVECGWSRPYAPMPREGAPMVPNAPQSPETALQPQRGALEDTPDV